MSRAPDINQALADLVSAALARNLRLSVVLLEDAADLSLHPLSLQPAPPPASSPPRHPTSQTPSASPSRSPRPSPARSVAAPSPRLPIAAPSFVPDRPFGSPPDDPLVLILSPPHIERVRQYVSTLAPPLARPTFSSAPPLRFPPSEQPAPLRAKRASFHQVQEGVSLKRSRVASEIDPRSQRPLSMPSLRTPAHEPFWGTVLPPPTAQRTSPSASPFAERASAPSAEQRSDPRDEQRLRPLFEGDLGQKGGASRRADEPSPLVASVHARSVAALTPRQPPPFAQSVQVGASAAFGQPPAGAVSAAFTPSVSAPASALRAPVGSSPFGADRGDRSPGAFAPPDPTAGSPFGARSKSVLPRLPAGDLPRLPLPGAASGSTAALPALRSLATHPHPPGGTPLPPPRDLYEGRAPGALFASGSGDFGTRTGGAPGAPQYDCPQCEATFRRRSDMNRHVRVVHEKQRPFACPTCQNRFGEKSNMLKHVRMVHQNIRHFRCPHCQAAFGQRGNCEAHIRAVHEKRPGKYECAVPACARAFARKAHLLDHFAADHPGVPPPVTRARPRAASSSAAPHQAATSGAAPPPERTASAPPGAAGPRTARATPAVFESAARSLLQAGFRQPQAPGALPPAPTSALFDASGGAWRARSSASEDDPAHRRRYGGSGRGE